METNNQISKTAKTRKLFIIRNSEEIRVGIRVERFSEYVLKNLQKKTKSLL